MLSEKEKNALLSSHLWAPWGKIHARSFFLSKKTKGPAKILEIQRILNLQLGKIHFKVLFFHLISPFFFIFKECYLLHFWRERVFSCLILTQITCQFYIYVKMLLFWNASIYIIFSKYFRRKIICCIHC